MRNLVLAVSVLAAVAAGQSWSSQTSGTNDNLDGVWFVENIRGWAVGDAGTSLRTTNGGQTWTSFFLTNQDLEDVAFHGGNSAVGLIVGDDGRIFRTTDGGANWSQVSSGTASNLRAVAFSAGSAAYVAGRDGVILRSTDLGASWSVVETGSVRWEGIWAFGENLAWVVGREGNIKATANAGASWGAQSSSTGSDLHGVFFIDGQNGWAVGQNDVALKTTNGGASWALANAGINVSLDGVHFESAGEGWVVGSLGRIWRSTNGGANWVQEASPVSSELNDVFFTDPNHGWAVGASGRIVTRIAAGIEEQPAGSPSGSIEARPNPMTSNGTISYSVPAPGRVEVRVIDGTGRLVRTLASGTAEAGRHSLSWDRSDAAGRPVASGVYFYEIAAGAVARLAVVVVDR
ncbi:MAG: YCF48-related protein [bacterium]